MLRVEKDDWKFRRAEALRLLGMGVPVGLQFSITAIGSVLLQSAVNSLGATYVSGAAAASKLFQLFCCPYDTLATAATSFTGQNLGAGKYDRIRQGTRACNMIEADLLLHPYPTGAVYDALCHLDLHVCR